MTFTDSDIERLMAYTLPEPNSGCWLWIGGVFPRGGYGHFHAVIDGRKRSLRAHRVHWQLIKGEIPEGLELDHLCRVPCCVNPLHLEPVKSIENIRRALIARFGVAEKTHCPLGHEYVESNIYRDPKGFKHCRACQKKWTKDNRLRRAMRLSAPVIG